MHRAGPDFRRNRCVRLHFHLGGHLLRRSLCRRGFALRRPLLLRFRGASRDQNDRENHNKNACEFHRSTLHSGFASAGCSASVKHIHPWRITRLITRPFHLMALTLVRLSSFQCFDKALTPLRVFASARLMAMNPICSHSRSNHCAEPIFETRRSLASPTKVCQEKSFCPFALHTYISRLGVRSQ